MTITVEYFSEHRKFAVMDDGICFDRFDTKAEAKNVAMRLRNEDSVYAAFEEWLPMIADSYALTPNEAIAAIKGHITDIHGN